MFFELIDIFWKLIYTNLITFLDLSKDHFARPTAKKFGLLCKFDFPIFSKLLEHFLICYLIDFLLLFPRDVRGPVRCVPPRALEARGDAHTRARPALLKEQRGRRRSDDGRQSDNRPENKSELPTRITNAFLNLILREFPQDNFASPPGKNIGLLCKCDFPTFLDLPGEIFIFQLIIDFLLLFPRDRGDSAKGTGGSTLGSFLCGTIDATIAAKIWRHGIATAGVQVTYRWRELVRMYGTRHTTYINI